MWEGGWLDCWQTDASNPAIIQSMSDSGEEREDYTAFTLSDQHNSETGSFSELSKAYKDNPTIEHYAKLRRDNRGQLIEISTNWSLDWCLANQERVAELGIDIYDIVGSLDGDEACASRFSLRLIELIIERRARKKAGDTHLVGRGEVISDSLVNYLIAMMLDALDWNDQMTMPRDLIVLIKHQLGADTSNQDMIMTVKHSRQTACALGAQLKAQGETVSLDKIAKIMSVERSTVLRWFKGEDFHQEVEQWFRIMDDFHKGNWPHINSSQKDRSD